MSPSQFSLPEEQVPQAISMATSSFIEKSNGGAMPTQKRFQPPSAMAIGGLEAALFSHVSSLEMDG